MARVEVQSKQVGCPSWPTGKDVMTTSFAGRRSMTTVIKVKLSFEYLALDGEPDLQVHRPCDFAQPFYYRQATSLLESANK